MQFKFGTRYAHVRYSNVYNKNKRDLQFEPGQKVWRRNKTLSDQYRGYSAKLAPKYVLCTVSRRVSPIIYELLNPDGSRGGRWHVSNLKPYFEPGDERDAEDGSDQSDSDRDYEPQSDTDSE
ncbi:hypothetical protein MTP99_003903 [Tenebrio molitor]|jgi:hypothetical protein|nr:hypothetical protein MTP99_003903 [Tenebrio molitor]